MKIAIHVADGVEKFFDTDMLLKYSARIMDDIGLVEQANKLSAHAMRFAKIAAK